MENPDLPTYYPEWTDPRQFAQSNPNKCLTCEKYVGDNEVYCLSCQSARDFVCDGIFYFDEDNGKWQRIKEEPYSIPPSRNDGLVDPDGGSDGVLKNTK